MDRYLKKILAAVLALGILGGILNGCSASGSGGSANVADAPGNSDSNTSDGSYDLSAEENIIRFAVPAGNIRTAIFILADQLGYYDEEQVRIEYVNAQGTDALAAITSNNNDLDVLGLGIVPTLTFIADGSDLVLYGGTAAEGGSIIARPDEVAHYKDLTNFENITAALVRGESAWIITRALLVDAGVDVDTITLLEVDSQANVAQAVAKGEADVGFLPMEYSNSLRDIGIEVVYETGELDPNYVCCRQVTSRQKLEEKHDALVRFTIANLRAWEYYNDESNRDEIISLLADFSDQSEDYVRNYLFENRTVLTLDPNEYGIINYYQSLGDTGYLDISNVDVADHIDTSLYSEALSEILKRYPDDPFFQDKLELYREYNDALI